jgi:microsomal dipeptidase-like Zn-dependent dipeptidase
MAGAGEKKSSPKSLQRPIHSRSEEPFAHEQSHAQMVARGFSDEEIERILRENWMRIFKHCL